MRITLEEEAILENGGFVFSDDEDTTKDKKINKDLVKSL
jgi:hypothetical protein